MRGDVEVRVLECAGQSEYQGYVFLLVWLFADDVHCSGRTGRESAGKRRIVMDVELEEVIEWVGHLCYGAVVVVFDAVV